LSASTEALLAKAMLHSGMNSLFLEMTAKNTVGAKSLGLMTLGFRKFCSKKEIKSIADIKGTKVRVQATKTEDRFFSAMAPCRCICRSASLCCAVGPQKAFPRAACARFTRPRPPE
jgi:hypothetical protein